MDLSGFEAVTIYVTTCSECGTEVHSETKGLKLCGLCQIEGQVIYLHHVRQYQRWGVIPTRGRYAEVLAQTN